MSRFITKVKAFYSLLPCFYPPWLEKKTSLGEFRQVANELTFHEKSFIMKWSLYVLHIMVWYSCAPFLIMKKLKQKGEEISSYCGKSIRKQLIELIILSYWYWMHPKAYYYYRLWEYDRYKEVQYYLFAASFHPVIRFLNQKEHQKILNDKYAFFKFCQFYGIPTPQVFAQLQNEHINWLKPLPELTSIVFKRQVGSKGIGLSVWLNQGGAFKHEYTQECCSLTELEQRFSINSYQNDYLIQEKLSNHSVLRLLGNHQLATVRILTLKTTNQVIELVHSILRLPTQLTIREQKKNVELICSLVQDSGEIIAGFCPALLDPIRVHPDNNVKITGVKLPFWKDIKCAVTKAHGLIEGIPLIAWDVAISDKGYFLLEGNLNMELSFHQVPTNGPLAKRKALLKHLLEYF